MSKTLFIIWLGVTGLLVALGYRNTRKIDEQNRIILGCQSDTARYNKQVREQQVLLSNLHPSDDLVKPREEKLPNAMANPYLSASQGVEVHLEGIRWENRWFTASQKHGIDKLNGLAEVQLNQILFDPDFEKAGMPDLNVEVTAPRFFEMKSFLKDWLEGFDLSGFLGQSFSDRKPIRTYDLESTPGTKQKMSLWLMEFDAFLRIEPSPDHDNTNVGGLEKHPVTGVPTGKIRREDESKNQRYGNVSVMLKFKPKNGTWYIASRDESGVLVPNGEPQIGIGAVECIGIKQVSENKNVNNIGVYIRKGSSLALYNSPEEIDSKYYQNTIRPEDLLRPIESKVYTNGSEVNPNLFGKEKYAIIHLANLGSWQEGSWFSKIHRYADLYHARFVIHTYVLGEWTVQPVAIAKPEPRPPFELKKAGLLDFLLPDFNLGFFGKLLSGGGWVIIGLIVLSLFFPPIGALINKVLGWLVSLLPGK